MKKEFTDRCEGIEIHEELLKAVTKTMPKEDEIVDLAELFKLFGDATRMKILLILLQTDACTCDLAALLLMTPSAISHQLNILKRAKLVKNRREGKSVLYSLADHHVRTVIQQGLEHIEE